MGQRNASPVAVQPQADTLTYEPYFGLNEKPFSLNADSRFIYDSPTYGATSASLLAGIRRREGLLVLTGEIGTGKTTLCRSVLCDLGRNTHSALVPDPFVSREDLLKMLLIDFGVLSIQELTAAPLREASRTELGYLLSGFLDSLAADAFAVVVIDEAQNLSLPLIEETRILSDTFGATGRLQIVLVGQPELHGKLKLPEMRQVDQRVCGYHRLGPMSRTAVAGYIQHRLQVAGARCERVLFPPEIVDGLHSRSGGVPRLINRICDRALQLAYERQAASVDKEILEAALIEIGAVTLSPTWDSIIAELPVPLRAAAPAPPATPTLPAPPVASPPIDEAEEFRQQIAHWLEQELASRSNRPLPAAAPPPPAALAAPVAPPPGPAPAAAPVAPLPIDDDDEFTQQVAHWLEQELASPSRRRLPVVFADERPTDTVTTDWPQDMRSETYMHRLLRQWVKWGAISLAVFATLNAAVVGAALLPVMLSPATLPVLPKAPPPVMPGIALAEVPLSNRPATSASPAVSIDYFVDVGVFPSRDRADQILDALTQHGLPAMQRPVQLRTQQLHQVVLGPFFSRADAVADLRRLQALGGYHDARVIGSSREP